MAAEPPRFEIPIQIEDADIDRSGHVNNVTYVRWVQDAAVAHWRAVAHPQDQEQLRWVVLRHEVDYKRPALPGDGILARTWVGQASGLRFERYTEILRAADAAVLARALTLWCPIDAQTGRPAKVSQRVREAFSVEEQ